MLTFCTNKNDVDFISFLFIIRTSLHINLTFRAVKTCIDHMDWDGVGDKTTAGRRRWGPVGEVDEKVKNTKIPRRVFRTERSIPNPCYAIWKYLY